MLNYGVGKFLALVVHSDVLKIDSVTHLLGIFGIYMAEI